MPGVKMPALPTWNKRRTDVLPQYKLMHAHMICQTRLTHEMVVMLARTLGLGELVYAGDFDANRLPLERKYRNLGDRDNAHLLVTQSGDCFVLFAPFRLLHPATKWIEWNSICGRVMAIATQYDDTVSFYNVFRNGSRVLSARADGSSIRYQEEDKIQISVDGVLVVDEPGGMPPQDPEVDAVLASDARIVVEGDRIYVRELISGKPVENIMHYVFVKDA